MFVRFGPCVAAALVVAIVATACDGGSPAASPSPRPSPTGGVSMTRQVSASPSAPRTGPLTTGPNVRPGEKPPAFPDAARVHDPGGALAFAFYYFAVMDWAFATSSAAELDSLSLPTCTGCATIVRSVEAVRSRGDWIKGGRIAVSRGMVDRRHYKTRSDAALLVVYTQGPIAVAGPTAQPSPVSTGAVISTSVLFVDWTYAGWRVRELARTR